MKLLTLDMGGYISDPPLVADRIMRNFFVANYSQTNVHYGDIHSLPYIIYQYAEDMLSMSDAIKNNLQAMFTGFFNEVNVTVDIVDLDESIEVKKNIIIDVVLRKDVNTFSLGRLVEMTNGKISGIREKE